MNNDKAFDALSWNVSNSRIMRQIFTHSEAWFSRVIAKHWQSRKALASGTFQAYSGVVKVETETSKKLKAWQELRQLTQPQAASMLGVPFATYRNWIGGRREPSVGMKAAIDRLITK